MTRVAVAAFAGLLVLPTAGCERELTEVMVVVDSDLAVPDQIDTIQVDVTSPQGEFRRASATLVGDRGQSLPRTLGVVHRGGPLGPVTVVASGKKDGRDVIQRHARLSFVQGETMVLRMPLLASCLGIMCPIDQTCGAQGQCRTRDVAREELTSWDGTANGVDGGTASDGGVDGGNVCVPAEEACNTVDDDCDGDVDEGFDLQTDPSNCGACGNTCAAEPVNASSRCVAGACEIVCETGWDDCDKDESTGCEASISDPSTCGDCDVGCGAAASLCADDGSGSFECVADCPAQLDLCGQSCIDTDTSPLHCGDCGVVCPSRPQASPACDAGSCDYVCDEGWFDCNGLADDGCESRLASLDDCGECGQVCSVPMATESCGTGTCSLVSCDEGWGDCNDALDDGCETEVLANRTHCGECGRACPAEPDNGSAVCEVGECFLTCEDGWDDCNDDAGDGCEADLGSSETCGSCGIRCPPSGSCCDGTCCGPGETCCGNICCGRGSECLEPGVCS